jgi:hypothetical protein
LPQVVDEVDQTLHALEYPGRRLRQFGQTKSRLPDVAQSVQMRDPIAKGFGLLCKVSIPGRKFRMIPPQDDLLAVK